MTTTPADVRRLSASVDYLHAHKCLTDAARLVAVKRIDKLSKRARRKRGTLIERVLRRLAVPCAPSELAASLRRSVTIIRATLFNLKRAGQVARMDRTVPVESKRGRKYEYLWQRKYREMA